MGLFSNRSQLTLRCVFLLFQGGGDCSCQAGLSCMLTKNMIYNGQVIPVKQCMPEGMDIEVEEVDLDNQSADEPMRTKRFLFNVRILITFIFALKDWYSRKGGGGWGGGWESVVSQIYIKIRCNFYKIALHLRKSLNQQHRLSTHPFLGHDTAVPKILRISNQFFQLAITKSSVRDLGPTPKVIFDSGILLSHNLTHEILSSFQQVSLVFLWCFNGDRIGTANVDHARPNSP